MVDYGDAPTVPGYHEETLRRIEAFLAPVHAAGVTPLVPRRRPLDGARRSCGRRRRCTARWRWCTWTPTPTCGTRTTAPATSTAPCSSGRWRKGWSTRRRRCRRGCAARSTAPRTRRPGRLGYDAIPWAELAELTPAEYGDRVRARVGDRRGVPLASTSTSSIRRSRPAPARPRWAARRAARRSPTCARSTGIDFRAFDCVEVAPAYDPAGITSWLAASACHEMLSLLALRRRDD